MAVHAFPKGMSRKVNVIAQIEFELINCNVAAQNINHHPQGIPLKILL